MAIKDYVEGNTQDDWIKYIVNSVQGTCKGYEEELDEYLDEGFDEDALLQGIDENIFNCVVCGWWYETGEESSIGFDEQVCTKCEDDYE